ncbi:MAG: 50S ribosomal protein L25 [Patescibacteria group bacterium]
MVLPLEAKSVYWCLMSENQFTLTITPREILGKTSKRLPKDKMAAVYYGRKEKATPVVLQKSEFTKVYKKAGESSVVTLDNQGKKLEALIHEVDFDPIKGDVRHADFYILEKGRKVKIDVPLHFEGESEAVKSLGGILVKVMREIEIEAEPKDLPHTIAVDISALLGLDSQITVADLKLPNGVRPTGDVTEVVASITVAKEEIVEEPIDLSTIEVEKKGKVEEEGAEVVEERAEKKAEKKPEKK